MSKRAKAPRCKNCGSTKGRHYAFGWADGTAVLQCPERYQPGIISGIPSIYFEPVITPSEPTKGDIMSQFSFGDRVHVAFPDPFDGTIVGTAAHDETLWEVAAPVEWCVRNNNAARIQFVRAPFLTKLAAPMSAAEAGRRGGQANIAKHGPEFYREIGRKGGAKVKSLVSAAKAAAAATTGEEAAS